MLEADKSPKFQKVLSIAFPNGGIEVFVNETSEFMHPILVVKLAVGACPVIVTIMVSLATQLFVFVTITEYCPVVVITMALLLELVLHVYVKDGAEPEVKVIELPAHKDVSGPRETELAKLSSIILSVSDVIEQPNKSFIFT